MTESRLTFELPRDAHAPAAARAALGGFSHALDEPREDASRLLVSELVTNAVKYGGEGPVRIEVTSDPGRFRAEVIDEGSGFVAKERVRDQEGGWGLPLVEHLADRWGTFEGSTHVWFELDLSDA
jgi:anti-sigma regulatory factor (Ser/Thr protein kinase)